MVQGDRSDNIILKPLSAISDVDALYIQQLWYDGGEFVPTEDNLDYYIKNVQRVIDVMFNKKIKAPNYPEKLNPYNKIQEIIDYLRYKSYNCGYGKHSPQDLVELGIVTETENKQP